MTQTPAIARRTCWVGMSLGAACLVYFRGYDAGLLGDRAVSRIFNTLLKADVRSAWISAGILLAAAIWNRPAPLLKWVDFIDRHRVAVIWASVPLFALGTLAIYDNYPLSMDEYAALFQSKIFASGHWWAQLPPKYVDWLVVKGFNGEFLIASTETGWAIEKYWPGFALLLTPFQWFGSAWLCNASLAGGALALIYWITLQLTDDRRAAGWALLFALASSAFIAEAISFYSMQAHLTANLAFAALLLQPSRRRALAAGLIGSIALNLHNPVPHALFAIPWLMSLAIRPEQRRYLWPLAVGYLPGLALGLAWLTLCSHLANVGADAAYRGIAHGIFIWPNLHTLCVQAASLAKLWVWAVPGLFVFAIQGAVAYRRDARAQLLAASALMTFAGYVFVSFDQGHGWGYRYFHSAWGVIPILAGCAMSRAEGSARMTSFAGAASLLSVLVLAPFQLAQIHTFIAAHLAQLAPPKRPGNNVYFVYPRGGFYVADMVQADPSLRAPDLIFISHGALVDAQLVQANWPGAKKIASGSAFEQWYLGPVDQRHGVPGSAAPRFVLAPDPLFILPSAADR